MTISVLVSAFSSGGVRLRGQWLRTRTVAPLPPPATRLTDCLPVPRIPWASRAAAVRGGRAGRGRQPAYRHRAHSVPSRARVAGMARVGRNAPGMDGGDGSACASARASCPGASSGWTCGWRGFSACRWRGVSRLPQGRTAMDHRWHRRPAGPWARAERAHPRRQRTDRSSQVVVVDLGGGRTASPA